MLACFREAPKMNTAMILAAGRGERLMPITDIKPKALCTVQGIPLIEYHINKLVASGVQRIVVNHAYLGSQIRQRLGDGSRWGITILYSPEPPGGLETGGGIVGALNLLGDKPFLVINADIYTDFPVSEFKLPEGSLAHLVLVEKPKYRKWGDFGLLDTNRLENTDRQYTYAGIAYYSPRAFESFKLGRYSVVPLLRKLANTALATGEVYSGMWNDIGSTERLLEANKIPWVC